MSAHQVIPDGFWSEPGYHYWSSALDELGLDQRDLERVPEDEWVVGFPIGLFPLIDAVYAKAWELRSEEQ